MKAILPLWVVGALALVGSSLCQAASLDLNLSGDAVQFEAVADVAPGIQLGGGVLDSDYRDDATVWHGQLLGVERTRNYEIGVGARWTQLDSDFSDGGGLGLGGYGYVYLPEVPALSLGGYGFYTPSVVTSGDLDDAVEYGVRARYAVTSNVDAYLGYRRFRADLDLPGVGTKTLDSGVHGGMRLVF
ncbi:YfaZ family outer membrane protein [Halomonas caseinilytica]|uniref:YfaZ family outer membrane protein n=1 Tax=Halomonas caseinilytica TaxID=438744 RepID=UPI000848372C|nr:YfaZ family outer membrane protein [Halomonas caseinilytica]